MPFAPKSSFSLYTRMPVALSNPLVQYRADRVKLEVRSPGLFDPPPPPLQYWFEKDVVWLEPSLAPCGSIANAGLNSIELARGFQPISPANYGPLPLTFWDMPIYKRYSGRLNVYNDYHVWVTAAVYPLALQMLITLRIGLQSQSLDQLSSYASKPATIIPIANLQGVPMQVDSLDGSTTAAPRYGYLFPAISLPPGWFDTSAAFCSLPTETGPV